MMNKLVLVVLLFGSIFLLGCIQGEQRHNIQSDGSDSFEIEVYKSGLFANGDCDQLKSYARSVSQNLTKEQINAISAAPCRETSSSVILNGYFAANDPNNKVKTMTKNGKEYLRYEDESSPFFEFTINMPSKITDTNGQKKDEQTAFFVRGELLSETKNMYVESEKPGMLGGNAWLLGLVCCAPLIIIVLVIAIYLILNKKKIINRKKVKTKK